MLRLMLNVSYDGCFVRTAHTECPISFLPREFDSVFSNPSRRIRFQNLDGLGHRDVGGQRDQKVDMICNTACCNDGNAMIPPDAGEIFQERGEKFQWYEITAFFGAEYTMNQDVSVAM